ncbi:unnamed protein product [Closterium sp. NIES-65]|nr:unnamed protein product [Closterium sp. NIES-65]
MCRPPDVVPGAAQSEAEEELDARWRAQQIDDAAAAYGGAWNWNPMTAPGGRGSSRSPPNPPSQTSANATPDRAHAVRAADVPDELAAARRARHVGAGSDSGDQGPLGYMSQGMAQGIPCGLPQEMEFHAGDMGAMSTDGMTAEELADLDPKKHKRMMSNRASAKRSRQRKQERLEELEIQSAKLRVENAAVTRRLNEAY